MEQLRCWREPQVRFSADNGVTWTTSDSWPPPAHSSAMSRSPATWPQARVHRRHGRRRRGFPHNAATKSIRSTDGGNTWTNTYTGPDFPGPGVTTCAPTATSPACLTARCYWRHMGWGEPAALQRRRSLRLCSARRRRRPRRRLLHSLHR